MTLTLEIPQGLTQNDAAQAERLLRAAIALYDARLVTQGQAAAMASMGRVEFLDALIQAGVSVIQYDSADEVLAEAALLAGRS